MVANLNRAVQRALFKLRQCYHNVCLLFGAMGGHGGLAGHRCSALLLSPKKRPTLISQGDQQNAATSFRRTSSVCDNHILHSPVRPRCNRVCVSRRTPVQGREYMPELWSALWVSRLYELHAGTTGAARQRATGVARADPIDTRDCKRCSDYGRPRSLGPLQTRS